MEIVSIVFLLLSMIELILGHGFLADPPARSSAWVYDLDFRRCCMNYDHAAMSCGGFSRQWAMNSECCRVKERNIKQPLSFAEGKCSICGEPFDQKKKLFGMGDPQYLGKIVRTYDQGSTISVTVVVSRFLLNFISSNDNLFFRLDHSKSFGNL